MHEDWIARWVEGRIGFHEAAGNALLQRHWRARGGRVLVPLCGKSVDMLWLAARGHHVVGVELAERAVHAFFAERGLEPERRAGALAVYHAPGLPIEIHCGDYLQLAPESLPPCDALYDRAALVAIAPPDRARYAQHTDRLLRADAERLVVTFEYRQAAVSGPPFAVPPDELAALWPGLERLAEREAIEAAPPKFRAAGLESVREVAWRSAHEPQDAARA